MITRIEITTPLIIQLLKGINRNLSEARYKFPNADATLQEMDFEMCQILNTVDRNSLEGFLNNYSKNLYNEILPQQTRIEEYYNLQKEIKPEALSTEYNQNELFDDITYYAKLIDCIGCIIGHLLEFRIRYYPDEIKDSEMIDQVKKYVPKDSIILTLWLKRFEQKEPTTLELKVQALKKIEDYGFYDLEKVKILSSTGQTTLFQCILLGKPKYQVAMLNYLGFISALTTTMKNDTNMFKMLAECLSSNKREVSGQVRVLCRVTTENKNRYKAKDSKNIEEVEYDYRRCKVIK